MLRPWRALAALLLAAVPLNAQTRVSAPSLVSAAPVSAAASAAVPLISAPTLGPAFLSAPALLAAPAASLSAAAPVPWLAAAAPAAASPSEPAAAVPAPAVSVRNQAAADGLKRDRFGAPGAENAPSLASGGRLFDGAGDLVTRSGSVFAFSPAPQPALRGDAGFVRVKDSPAAPVKAVADTSGLSGPALLARVSQIAAQDQTKHEYHEASKYLFSTADNHTLNGQPGVADAYSGVFVPGQSGDGHDYSENGDPTHDGWSRKQSMNVEHVFPQSLFKQDLPMRSDLHHLMATFEHPNGVRGSLPFGVAKAPFSYRNAAGARRDDGAFAPPDFTKGRVARAMLYFYARYKDEPFFDSRVAAFWNPQVATLLDWNRRFPPSVEEQRRNDHVQAFQGNRNPFVDDPGLADRIGGAALRSGPAAPARIDLSFAGPKLPPGAVGVRVVTVRSAADIDGAVPAGNNSKGLIAGLKRDVPRMAPYDIYVYADSTGGSFVGIDLSAHPAIVDMIPELAPHERALIKKIMERNPDVRVLVREEGKTPDLVVGGNVVELKSFIDSHDDYDSDMGRILFSKANEQVLLHGRRHHLGRGAVAFDLALHSEVPADIAKVVDGWRLSLQTELSVDKIYVFAGTQMVVFARQADGSFKVSEPVFALNLGGAARRWSAEDEPALRLLAGLGRRPAASAAS